MYTTAGSRPGMPSPLLRRDTPKSPEKEDGPPEYPPEAPPKPEPTSGASRSTTKVAKSFRHTVVGMKRKVSKGSSLSSGASTPASGGKHTSMTMSPLRTPAPPPKRSPSSALAVAEKKAEADKKQAEDGPPPKLVHATAGRPMRAAAAPRGGRPGAARGGRRPPTRRPMEARNTQLAPPTGPDVSLVAEKKPPPADLSAQLKKPDRPQAPKALSDADEKAREAEAKQREREAEAEAIEKEKKKSAMQKVGTKTVMRIFLDNAGEGFKTVAVPFPCDMYNLVEIMRKKVFTDTVGFGIYEVRGTKDLRLIDPEEDVTDVMASWKQDAEFKFVFKKASGKFADLYLHPPSEEEREAAKGKETSSHKSEESPHSPSPSPSSPVTSSPTPLLAKPPPKPSLPSKPSLPAKPSAPTGGAPSPVPAGMPPKPSRPSAPTPIEEPSTPTTTPSVKDTPLPPGPIRRPPPGRGEDSSSSHAPGPGPSSPGTQRRAPPARPGEGGSPARRAPPALGAGSRASVDVTSKPSLPSPSPAPRISPGARNTIMGPISSTPGAPAPAVKGSPGPPSSALAGGPAPGRGGAPALARGRGGASRRGPPSLRGRGALPSTGPGGTPGSRAGASPPGRGPLPPPSSSQPDPPTPTAKPVAEASPEVGRRAPPTLGGATMPSKPSKPSAPGASGAPPAQMPPKPSKPPTIPAEMPAKPAPSPAMPAKPSAPVPSPAMPAKPTPAPVPSPAMPEKPTPAPAPVSKPPPQEPAQPEPQESQAQASGFASKPIEEWSVEDVGAWLEELGFGKMKASFVENYISGMELVELTNDELKDDLGVTALGVRKGLLREIAKLKSD